MQETTACKCGESKLKSCSREFCAAESTRFAFFHRGCGGQGRCRQACTCKRVCQLAGVHPCLPNAGCPRPIPCIGNAHVRTYAAQMIQLLLHQQRHAWGAPLSVLAAQPSALGAVCRALALPGPWMASAGEPSCSFSTSQPSLSSPESGSAASSSGRGLAGAPTPTEIHLNKREKASETDGAWLCTCAGANALQ